MDNADIDFCARSPLSPHKINWSIQIAALPAVNLTVEEIFGSPEVFRKGNCRGSGPWGVPAGSPPPISAVALAVSLQDRSAWQPRLAPPA
jgi:hypothetical protein